MLHFIIQHFFPILNNSEDQNGYRQNVHKRTKMVKDNNHFHSKPLLQSMSHHSQEVEGTVTCSAENQLRESPPLLAV